MFGTRTMLFLSIGLLLIGLQYGNVGLLSLEDANSIVEGSTTPRDSSSKTINLEHSKILQLISTVIVRLA